MQEVLSYWEKHSRVSGFLDMQKKRPTRCSCGSAKFHKWGTYRRYIVEDGCRVLNTNPAVSLRQEVAENLLLLTIILFERP